MKNWFKKQKYKIAIALCSILSIFTLFLGINKTYAYSTNQLSYTINNVYNVTNSTNESITTLNNINGYIFNQSTNYRFDLINSTSNHQYFMINFYLIDINNNIVSNIDTFYWDFWLRQSQSGGNLYYSSSTNRINNNGYFTFICKGNNQNENILNSIYIMYTNTSYSNYNIFVFNLDYVNYTDIGISQYYDTYYGAIEDNYNNLLSDYNDLQDDYDTLESNYNTLESNYNDLESNYNNLQDNYDDLENDYNSLESSYESLAFEYNDLQSQFDTLENALSNLPNYNGMQSFIDSFNGATFELYGYAGISGKIENSPTYTLSNFNNSNFNLSRDTDTFYTWIQNNINTYGGFDLIVVLNVPYTTSLSCSFSNTNYNHTISIYSEVNGLAVATYDDYNNESVILINDTNNYSIVQIRLSLTQQDYDFILSSNIYGDQYMNGYNNGYNQSLIEWNSELNTARNTIESQRNTIRTLQQQLNTANQYDLNKLMWTIASTPFESFKQIWNVNFFGVNISTMITGFITGIIVLWIIKKFFL